MGPFDQPWKPAREREDPLTATTGGTVELPSRFDQEWRPQRLADEGVAPPVEETGGIDPYHYRKRHLQRTEGGLTETPDNLYGPPMPARGALGFPMGQEATHIPDPRAPAPPEIPGGTAGPDFINTPWHTPSVVESGALGPFGEHPLIPPDILGIPTGVDRDSRYQFTPGEAVDSAKGAVVDFPLMVAQSVVQALVGAARLTVGTAKETIPGLGENPEGWHSDAVRENLEPPAEMISAIAGETVKIPSAMHQPLVEALAPRIGQTMEEKGWTPEYVAEMATTDPIMLAFMVMPSVHGARKGGKKVNEATRLREPYKTLEPGYWEMGQRYPEPTIPEDARRQIEELGPLGDKIREIEAEKAKQAESSPSSEPVQRETPSVTAETGETAPMYSEAALERWKSLPVGKDRRIDYPKGRRAKSPETTILRDSTLTDKDRAELKAEQWVFNPVKKTWHETEPIPKKGSLEERQEHLEDPTADVEAFTEIIRGARGFWERGGEYEDLNRVTAKKNKKDVMRPGGESEASIAEQLVEQFPEIFKDQDAAIDWMQNVWAKGEWKWGEPEGRHGFDAAEKQALKMEREWIRDTAGDIVDKADKKGVKVSDRKARKLIQEDTKRVAESEVKEGDVFLGDDYDVYRVEKNPNPKINEGDYMLVDGRKIPFPIDGTIDALPLGKAGKPTKARSKPKKETPVEEAEAPAEPTPSGDRLQEALDASGLKVGDPVSSGSRKGGTVVGFSTTKSGNPKVEIEWAEGTTKRNFDQVTKDAPAAREPGAAPALPGMEKVVEGIKTADAVEGQRRTAQETGQASLLDAGESTARAKEGAARKRETVAEKTREAKAKEETEAAQTKIEERNEAETAAAAAKIGLDTPEARKAHAERMVSGFVGKDKPKPKRKKYGSKNRVVKPEKYEAAKKSFTKKAVKPNAAIDVSAYKELVTIGAYHAEALAHLAVEGAVQFREWAKAVQRDWQGMFPEGVDRLTPAQLRKLWNHRHVRIAKKRQELPAGSPARAQGELARFRRNSGDRGELAWHTIRENLGRINLGVRMLSDQKKKLFPKGVWATLRGKRFSRKENDALLAAWQGIPGLWKHDGSPKYGSLQRAGTRKLPKDRSERQGKLETEPPGTMLEDGTFVGGIIDGGRTQQLYRVIWPEEARAAHQKLKQDYPRAAEILDRILSEQEGEPIITAGGDRLPGLSRTRMKEQFGIDGLTEAEANMAAAYAQEAFGNGAGRTIPNELSWVPESALKGRTTLGRLRNLSKDAYASARRRKSGKAAEQVRDGTLWNDLSKSFTSTRQELFREQIYNDMVAQVFDLVAEEVNLKKGETLEGKTWELERRNHVLISENGRMGESVAFRRFLKSKRAWLEENGFDVKSAIDMTYMAGGKAYSMPKQIAEALGIIDTSKAKSADLKHQAALDASKKLFGDMVATINIARLSRLSTANRNLISQSAVIAARTMRDFYKGILDAQAMGKPSEIIRREGLDTKPMQPFVSNIRAAATSFGPIDWALSKAIPGRKRVMDRLPPELLGSTILMEMETGSGPIRRAVAGLVRATGFNYWDIYAKRTVTEAVLDANARQAWHMAQQMGETRGMTKSQYIAHYKRNTPTAVQRLAYREMDTFAFDYSNVPSVIKSMKKSPIGRAIVPYPTYVVKLAAMYNEMMGLHNVKTMWKDGLRTDQGRKAAANMAASATIFGALWHMIGDEGDLPEGVKDSELPYDVQRFGRVRVPGIGSADDGLWVRLYDIPFVGEVMAAKAIWGGDYSFSDFINDRLALGPLFNSAAIHVGLSNRFNADMTKASRMGREAASWLPFHAEMGAARRIMDPNKRVVGDKRRSSFYNLFSAFADNFPWMSTALPVRVDQYRLKTPVYHPMETTASWALLNAHFISEKDRQAAINLARLSELGDLKEEARKDLLREILKPLVDYHGETVAGKLKMAARTDEQELEIAIESAEVGIKITEAFKDREATVEMREQEAKRILDEHVKTLDLPGTTLPDTLTRSVVRQRSVGLINRLAKRDRIGLEETVIQQAPVRTRSKLRDMQRESK